jgi:hypothetical protein
MEEEEEDLLDFLSSFILIHRICRFLDIEQIKRALFYLLSSICAFAHIVEMMDITYIHLIFYYFQIIAYQISKLYVDVNISNKRYFGRNGNLQYFNLNHAFSYHTLFEHLLTNQHPIVI